MKAYKYRIYPTKEQAIALDETIEKCRLRYNKLLALKKDAYKKEGKNLSQFDLNRQLKENKEIHSQVSQNVSYRISKAYQNFFRRVKQGTRKKGFKQTTSIIDESGSQKPLGVGSSHSIYYKYSMKKKPKIGKMGKLLK